MKLLLHCCCGPCSVMPLQILRADADIEVCTFFYNPNIHPYTEYKKRRNAFREYMEMERVSFAIWDDYNMEEFLANVSANPAARCVHCYRSRLLKTAEFAAERGFDAISTSLLVSPYQKHELIKYEGEQAAAAFGLKFYYQDFRPYFRQGQEIARAKGLYMQGYCGCIYSEKDRYFKPKAQPLVMDNRWQKRENLRLKQLEKAEKSGKTEKAGNLEDSVIG